MNLLGTALLAAVLLEATALAAEGPLYVLQSNDVDPTSPSSQVGTRWYHWSGCDSAITHLETGLAVDAAEFSGRGQRIDVAADAPSTAIQIKVKRIGNPGPLSWQAGTAWDGNDLGTGRVRAESVGVNYEHFITLDVPPSRAKQIFVQLKADSGRCPDDYYAIYCTWATAPDEQTTIHSYTGSHQVGMMYRMIRPDPHGAALEPDGRPVAEGASMMTRLLTGEPGPQRRALLTDEQETYRFVDDLAAGVDPRRAGLPWPDVRGADGEIILADGWQIRVAAPRSPQVETAVADLREFLRHQMKVDAGVIWGASVSPGPRSITLSQGPEVADGPRRPAGYRFVVQDDSVTIHGFDARGVLRGVWYLEELLMLRGGPFLKADARTREPRYSPRTTCSAWAGTGELATPAPVYTDAHLSLISHYGYDAIWLCWCPGPERTGELPTHIAPGRTPQGTTYQPFTARLRDLTERAERYDLEVVLQWAAPHPTDEAQTHTVEEQARQLVRDVPKIRTVVLLDEGMGSVRHGLDAWVSTCSGLARAFWEVKPDLNVVAWTYTFAAGAVPPDTPKWDQYIERLLKVDRRVSFMANFDSFWARRRDGLVEQRAYDYCLSLKAPSVDYAKAVRALSAEAERDGKPPRPLWAKIETRFSQESNTQPEIPSMQRWVERYQAISRVGPPPIGAVFGNWYHQGFYPTPVTELFGWLSYTGGPEPEELLRAMARRDFGPGQEDLVTAAWHDFSEAIWHYPFYYGLSYTMNSGYAQPFWLDPEAPNPRPWRRGFANSLKTLGMTRGGEGPGSGSENRTRLAKLDALWTAGLEKLGRAVEAAPDPVRSRAESQLRTAQSFGDKAEVTLRLVEWLDARDRFHAAGTQADKTAALDELERIGREELSAAQRALAMYRRDSRLGHLNHGRGCSTAMTIEWKIALLERVLADELPALRQQAQEGAAE
ncbi:MAG: hypothetical protein ABIK89_22455 [Planctomycetota bacterium]